MVHSTSVCSSEGITPKPKDIVFTEVDANWVHHPGKDALVIIAKIANSLVHRILVETGMLSTFYIGALTRKQG